MKANKNISADPLVKSRVPTGGECIFTRIPESWSLKKIGFVASLRSGESITSEQIRDSGDYPVYGGNGLRGYCDSYTHDGEYVLIGRQGALCGNVNYAEGKFWASEHAIVAHPREKFVSNWFGEALRAMDLNQYSLSAAQPGLSVDSISSLKIAVPPLSTQTKIATFLRHETTAIDALTVEKQRMLELLDEKRAAYISRAVTRGIAPQARLQPSNNPWLGDVPKHWDIERSKRVLKERNDRSETGEEEMLTVSHITGVTKRSEKEVNMFEAESNEGYKLVSPGNLVINTLWAWMGAMGVSQDDGIVSPAYHVYTLSPRLHAPYLDLLVRTKLFAKEVIRFSKGIWSSRLRLYPEGLFEVYLPVPPLSEQRAIVASVRKEDQKTADLRASLAESIRLLKERRSALITAAVTGKISEEKMAA